MELQDLDSECHRLVRSGESTALLEGNCTAGGRDGSRV